MVHSPRLGGERSEPGEGFRSSDDRPITQSPRSLNFLSRLPLPLPTMLVKSGLQFGLWSAVSIRKAILTESKSDSFPQPGRVIRNARALTSPSRNTAVRSLGRFPYGFRCTQ